MRMTGSQCISSQCELSRGKSTIFPHNAKPSLITKLLNGWTKAINDKVRLYAKVGAVLVEAREQGNDPFAAIEAVPELLHAQARQ
jgi:ribosome-associated translation inhibitor RaiA